MGVGECGGRGVGVGECGGMDVGECGGRGVGVAESGGRNVGVGERGGRGVRVGECRAVGVLEREAGWTVGSAVTLEVGPGVGVGDLAAAGDGVGEARNVAVGCAVNVAKTARATMVASMVPNGAVVGDAGTVWVELHAIATPNTSTSSSPVPLPQAPSSSISELCKHLIFRALRFTRKCPTDPGSSWQRMGSGWARQ
jgi:hypothetical protein